MNEMLKQQYDTARQSADEKHPLQPNPEVEEPYRLHFVRLQKQLDEVKRQAEIDRKERAEIEKRLAERQPPIDLSGWDKLAKREEASRNSPRHSKVESDKPLKESTRISEDRQGLDILPPSSNHNTDSKVKLSPIKLAQRKDAHRESKAILRKVRKNDEKESEYDSNNSSEITVIPALGPNRPKRNRINPSKNPFQN